jgi:NodT family efflux transporter outer membrane factor (OMF) lipoprotein
MDKSKVGRRKAEEDGAARLPALKGIAAAVMIATLAGCATMQAEPLPEVATPGGWRNAPAAHAEQKQAEASWPDPQWWGRFGSPELVTLIASAEKNNHDLAAAGHRIAQARANLRVAESALAPTVDVNAAASRSGADGGSSSNSLRVSLSAGYELDVWGRNRAGSDAAAASLDASGYAREVTRLTVVGDAASAYFQLLSLSDRLDTAREQLANAHEFLTLLEVQLKAGAVSQFELARQRNLVASLEAAIPPIVQGREQTLDALAVLLGVPPADVSVKGGSLGELKLPALVPGLPAELLARRPDLRRAEAELVAAGANLQAARAAMLPRIDLSLGGTLQAMTLGGLTGPGALAWSLLSGVAQTIFDGGRLAGSRDGADARRLELVENYRQAILVSLKDVEDALSALRNLAEQQAAQQRALDHARESYRLAEVRWRAGAQDFTTVLDAQRTLIGAEASLDPILSARFSATVALYKALGGDWAATQASTRAAPASRTPS